MNNCCKHLCLWMFQLESRIDLCSHLVDDLSLPLPEPIPAPLPFPLPLLLLLPPPPPMPKMPSLINVKYGIVKSTFLLFLLSQGKTSKIQQIYEKFQLTCGYFYWTVKYIFTDFGEMTFSLPLSLVTAPPASPSLSLSPSNPSISPSPPSSLSPSLHWQH